MTTTEKRASVRVEKHLPASPERIFDAWLHTDTARKFLFATEGGAMVRVAIDARPGGGFVMVDKREGQEIEHVGSYLEIDRPHRLVFDFAVPKFSAERTRVSVAIRGQEPGSVISITHEVVVAGYEERARQGWSMMLDRLASAII
ncbi:MAG: SRPBCC domain-containing protein [Alphaproteobacteria bacterium]|nr:SRPBCC domain-containing protein [Alphaproteobacteria bacterium]